MSVGLQALYKYQTVRYSHIAVGPGASYVLTADPWAFLTAHLQQKLDSGIRGKNRKCNERALYYVQLAEDFYRASGNTDLPIKGTLTYYGMLNLVKAYISTSGAELEQTYEHHGLQLPQGSQREVQVSSFSNSQVSIFAEFIKTLTGVSPSTHVAKLQELARNIPELHELAYTLELLPWTKRKYLPVDINFLVNPNKTSLFVEMRYSKRNEQRVDTNRFFRGNRKNLFNDLGELGEFRVFRSKRRKKITATSWPAIYKNFQIELATCDICSILTRDGYKYYIDLRPGSLPQLGYVLALVFYAGTVTRYRPRETTELLKGKFRPIISEALSTLPRQFLYQLTGMISKSVCVKPKASI